MNRANVVSKKNAAQLRLHVEEPVPDDPATWSSDELAGLCAAVRELTGWSLEFTPERSPLAESPGGNRNRGGRNAFRLQRCPQEGAAAPVERHKVQRLAETLAEVVRELDLARDAVWRCEADLAAGVPVTPHGNEQQHLAARLEAALKGGAQAVGCQAAALYLLDDATTELKLRACWGLPKQRLLALPRPLRGAMADLEALVGHAVVLEDTSLLPQWRVPEPYDSAVCVPVSSPTEPLGTLWMFCDHPRDFSPQQTNLVEIIAGRVASELQREMLLRECLRSKYMDRHLMRAIQWQNDRLPSIAPLLDGWSVSGWTPPTDTLRTSFFDWFVPPDGRLGLAAGHAEGSSLEAALTAAALHGALRAHASHPHNAPEMLDRLNETVWSSSAGGQIASLAYALVCPATGQVEWACAGSACLVVLTPETVIRMPATHALLGVQPGQAAATHHYQLQAGEVLVAFSGVDGDPSETATMLRQSLLTQAETGNPDIDWESCLAQIERSQASDDDRPRGATPAMLAVRRRQP